MKKIIFLFMLLTFSVPTVYAFMLQEDEKNACEKLLRLAEGKQIEKVYDMCSFNDEGAAWYQWAPLRSSEENKKALYELCRRHPTHQYAHLYCQKSADLGYLPALYWLAKEAEGKGDKELYQKYLEQIVSERTLRGKRRLITTEDFIVRQAHEDLSQVYLETKNDELRAKGIRYLQMAADAGSPVAAHTLGVLLYWNPSRQQQNFSKRYLWKAISLGCPAAEENLGLMNYLEHKQIDPNDAKEAIESRLFTCQQSAPSETNWDQILRVEDCACPEVMEWFSKQQKKPFMISYLFDGNAILKDPMGQEYSVTKGDKVGDGFVVEDVRSNVVIVRKTNERYVLYYRSDAQCVELCANPNVIPKRLVKDIPPYELKFTDDECLNLARGIENLNNPMAAFRGLPECQLQDWEKWGEQALAENRNKHLFLLANYEASNYIPAAVAWAERLIAEGVGENAGTIERLLTNATQSDTVDELSEIKKEQAFCLLTKVYMEAQLYQKAFASAKDGYEKGYPESTNMLGVLYAKGLGVEKDLDKAGELFLEAEQEAFVPFIEARQNYLKSKSDKEPREFEYGQCQNIVNPPAVSVEKLLELY